MKNNIREQRAITLVALIITIIVLLILAIVSINLVMNGGVIDKSKNAVDKYSQEEVQEQIKLAYSEWQMGQYSGVTEDAPTFVKNKLNSIYGAGTVTNVTEENGTFTVEFANGKQYTYNVATGVASKVKTVDEYPTVTATTDNQPVQENSKYTVDGKTAVIPAGYAISNTVAEQSIDNGLVIKKGNNEWVWIPVANVTDLYTENTTNTEWILCGTSGESKVVSQYASKARTDVASDLTRTTPGTTDDPYYREPDTVVGSGTEYDNVESNWTAAGFTTLDDMATSLKDDYKNMIESVRKNGGFYVGRYELSSAGTKKNQASLNANWYNSYKACKDIDSSGVVTAMIWGCQWDQVCNFIHSSGDQVSLTNSASYGNYSNSTVSGHGTKQVTGYSDTWKANNIYDLAGNCWEWTQEADYSYYRAVRGGYCGSTGGSSPVAYRNVGSPASTDSYLSSRPTLYIK